ncbi:hypothetical protein J7413_01960 [Shimia sp. R10_1]|uniref:hypothetical protein n=1 Tax=Shimia sp. R10_1 TaxID=2821095 RepID=UPI001ADD25B2|nr:hypothetical protein [Shimia sp. R10_1]MBO9472290.1 hypothetical protein [Shimia sp. R10_1]
MICKAEEARDQRIRQTDWIWRQIIRDARTAIAEGLEQAQTRQPLPDASEKKRDEARD